MLSTVLGTLQPAPVYIVSTNVGGSDRKIVDLTRWSILTSKEVVWLKCDKLSKGVVILHSKSI